MRHVHHHVYTPVFPKSITGEEHLQADRPIFCSDHYEVAAGVAAQFPTGRVVLHISSGAEGFKANPQGAGPCPLCNAPSNDHFNYEIAATA